MKTHYWIFLISLLLIGISDVAVANNPVKKGKKVEQTAVKAVKMVQKWAKDVQLTKAQQTQLMEKTIEYLQKHQDVINKEYEKNKKKDKGKKVKPSEEQKTALQEISRAYQFAIESILTEEQKAMAETIKEKRSKEIREKAQQAAKNAMSKDKKNK